MSEDVQGAEKPKVVISEVIGLLRAGKTRPEIAEHYSISLADMKRLFQHPELKGKKTTTKKEPKELPFEIVNDIPVADPVTTSEGNDTEVEDEAEVQENAGSGSGWSRGSN